MQSLDMAAPQSEVRIARIEGNVRLATRLASVGVVPGSVVRVEKNDRNCPVLIYERDTMLAINRNECASILIEGVE